MERHPFALKIHAGQMTVFRQKLGQIWPDLTHFLDQNGISNFSLWNIDQIVFGYCETQDGITASYEDWQLLNKINQELSDTYAWISNYHEPMRLMYYNYGIIRSNKDLICKKVFVTRLHDGMAQEYKNRHDALLEKNKGRVNPGPMSNFTIWNAQNYIFGYSELDSTMVKEKTEEGKQWSIAWENKMLEIMDWITDDIDWITGQRHSHIECIAHHN